MEWVVTIQKAIKYIEDHLFDEISYEDIAHHVHTSSYEFHRTFSFLTGLTINTYIRNRRLSLAGIEVIESNAKITDLAFKYGYETPESFTKAFTRFHGYSPKYVRENPVKLCLFNPLVIKLYMEGGNFMNYKIVQTKKQKFLAIVRSFRNEIINDESNHEIPDFWTECGDNKTIDKLLSLRKEGQKDLYGLCTPSVEGSTTFNYGIGILLDDDTLPCESNKFTVWNVEEGTYVVFDCIGDDGDCISETWAKFYKEFLPQTGYKASESTDYEIYFEKGQDGVFCELWIPIKK